MRPRALLLSASASLACLLVSPACGPDGHGLSMYVVHVKGRLVDATTGEAVAGARVLSFETRSEAENEEEVASILEWNDQTLKAYEEAPATPVDRPHPRFRALRNPEATTDGTGAFELWIRVMWCTSYRNGRPCGPTEPPARSGVEVLWIQSPGDAAPTILPVGGGQWQSLPVSDLFDVWATWDLGALRFHQGK